MDVNTTPEDAGPLGKIADEYHEQYLALITDEERQWVEESNNPEFPYIQIWNVMTHRGGFQGPTVELVIAYSRYIHGDWGQEDWNAYQADFAKIAAQLLAEGE